MARAVTKGLALRLGWKIHRQLFRVTKGRWLGGLLPGRQLLLVTTGRKSGEPREVVLTYLKDRERWIVIGSNAGDDRDPVWWLNLKSRPEATVTVDGNSFPVTAAEVEEPERSLLFERFVNEIDNSYLEYQRRTARRIPAIALSPR